MAFYESIAQYYDRIFPLDAEQIEFLKSAYIGQGDGLLDIGCGTGTILVALAPLFRRLAGLDLDPGLLAIASRKLLNIPSPPASGTPPYRIVEGDMRKVRVFFPEERFSLVTCLGNTIPHLTSPSDIDSFFASAFACVEPGGSFVFQIVNYDRVLDFAVRNLPLIARDGISFDRLYSAPRESGLIDFSTVLRDPSRQVVIRNSVRLYPLRLEEARQSVLAAGFSRCSFFGDYDGTPWKPVSPLTIGVCS
jgi:SAM-dependent methyltransferase